jgi:ribosome biogenesis GTPase / thiamine phosphate phosphatase
LYNIEYRELKNYYKDFNYNCNYIDCNHVDEDISECSIKKYVLEGKINKDRYERYKIIFNKLKEEYNRKYK